MFFSRSRNTRGPKSEPLRKRVEAHLGGSCLEAQALAHAVKPTERVNVQIVLDRWLEESSPTGRLFGFGTSGYYSDGGLAQFLINDDLFLAPVEREEVPSGPDEHLDCVKRGLFLLHRGGSPIALALRPPASYRSDLPVLEVMARDRQAARAALDELLDEAQKGSVYKGRAIAVERNDSFGSEFVIQFHEIRPTAREAIVLPDELLRAIERNVLGLLRHGETLRKAGRGTRHGLLLHGPPGTGKTLVTRYLAHACRNHTVIVLTGRQLPLVRESCQVAKLLAPSLVILEDVDLIAQERNQNPVPLVLHDLLDAMDGIGPRADCVFLLTTNRPDVLEPALSARPGRIDQAIEFPLPDAECRSRLFALYGQGLDLSAVNLPRWVTQSEGVSPAFIEELLRKAALYAAERGEQEQPLPVRDEDVAQAVHELVAFGGELTQKLLGYGAAGRMGFVPPA